MNQGIKIMHVLRKLITVDKIRQTTMVFRPRQRCLTPSYTVRIRQYG